MIKEIRQLGNVMDNMSAWNNPSVGRVYDKQGLAPTINTCSGGGQATAYYRRSKRRCKV